MRCRNNRGVKSYLFRLFHENVNLAVSVVFRTEAFVARRLAPGGHILLDSLIVGDDFKYLPRF